MKKVLSYVLVLCMILGSVGMAFAATPSDVVGEDCEDAVNVLIGLDVVEGYKDGSYKPENIVTRAEMATLLIKALGLNDYAVGNSSFSDMAGHWADPYVAYATSLGFIAGYTDGTFRPDEAVSYDQAITMAVQALGFKADYMTGGYPAAFVTQAKVLGMLDDIKSGTSGANRGDIAILLYNSLDAAFVRYDNEGAIQYTVVDKDEEGNDIYDSMMNRLGAYYGGYIVVSEADIEDAAVDIKEYLGARVEAWYNEDDEIIAVEEYTTFLTGDFNEDGDFETADKDWGVKADAEDYYARYFVNGAEIAATADDYMTLEALIEAETEDVVLAVRTSGNYITRVYSAAVWTDGETIQIDEDDLEAIAEDHELRGIAFEEDDDDEIDMNKVILLGVDSLEDIEEDDVVTYYVADDYVVRVEVSQEVVEGEVSKINSDGDVATINGKKYDINEDCDAFEVGDEGTFWLNYAGEIAYIDVTTEADDYAIVTYANKTDETTYGEDDVMKIKMLTADGEESVYVIDEDYVEEENIEDEDYEEADLIAYNLNKDGEIDQIDVLKTLSTSSAKVTAKGYLNGVKIADEVVVFIEDDGDYSVGALADVPRGEELNSSAYYIDEEDGEIVVIILDAEDQDDEDSVYGVVMGYGATKNSDDDKVYEVDMLVDGEEVSYLTVGRNVAISVDAALYEIEFDGSDVESLTAVTGAAVWYENTTVKAIKDGNLKVEDADYGDVYIEVADDVVVYEWDADEEEFVASKFSKISKGDLVTMYELDERNGDDDENGVDLIIFVEQ